MKKLKTILQSRKLFKIVFLFCILIAILRIYLFPLKSKYKGKEKNITGIVLKYKINGDHLTLTIKAKEKLIVHYYCQTKKEKDYFQKNLELGALIKINGHLQKPTNNTLPNLFNYKQYLLKESIFYLFQAQQIKMIQKNQYIFYKIKNQLEQRIDKIDKTGYFRTFLLGDKTILDEEVIEKYQSNGISHLFSISGMHVSFIVGILMYILNRLTYQNKWKYSIVSAFLIFYLYLTNKSASIMRTTILFILSSLNYCLNLKIKSLDLLLALLSIITLLNPFLLFDVGFQFSYVISASIILNKKKIAGYKKRWQQSLYISYLSFLFSFPICIYHFQSINCLSILFNLIMIPLISTIIFPLTFITMLLPNIYPLYSLILHFLENLNNFFYQINLGKLIFAKPNFSIVILYYIMIIFSLKKKKHLIILAITILIHWSYPYLDQQFLVTILDVGQGDCTFIKYPNQKGNILIDTGGKITYPKESWAISKSTNSLTTSKIIPYLNSLGITKLDYLILTHGDFDHIGEAINLVDHFQIENVVFNCGEYNSLEKNLIKKLEHKNIKYYSCIRKLNINQYKIQFLNTKIYNNENDNSNVLYFNYHNYKFLFMADAGIEKEKDILKEYNLKKIDFLKI